mgnify:CR=1 FL=1
MVNCDLTQLLQAGVNFDLMDDRFELGLNAMRLWDDSGSSMTAMGLEMGFVPSKGSMISIGYNKSKGSVAASDTLYQEGLYLRLRLTLDETLWDRLNQFGAD